MKEDIKKKLHEYYEKYGEIAVKCSGSGALPIDRILEFQGDLKKLSDKKMLKLAKSMFIHGYIAPMFLWDDGGDWRVLDAHQRLKTLLAIREAGIPIPAAFPYSEIEAANEADAKQKLLAITSQYGEFQREVLDEWIAEIDPDIAETFALVDTEIELAIASLDEKEETSGDDDVEGEAPAVTQLGDLWELGCDGEVKHRLLCGDSTKAEDVQRLMDGQKIDLVHTDPPYGIEESGKRSNRDGKTSLSKHIDYEDFQDDSIEYAIKAFKICGDLKIPRQVWWGANYYAHHIPQSNNWFVWDKRVEDKQKDTQSDCELAWVKSKWSSIRIFRHLWKGMIKNSENGEHRVHPTQKPIALAEWVFEYYKDVYTVLDLFGGSGFNLIACEKTEKKCFVMECSEKYCDVIRERYKSWCEKNGRTPIIKLNGEIWRNLPPIGENN